MPDDFVVARNPDEHSTLPYLLRIPLGHQGIILKAKATWPRTSKVYCHRVEEWPADAEIVERVPTRSCVRRGAAIDLVLDRHRENRSQLIITAIRGGRQAIFWQTARTTKQARPFVSLPSARASGIIDLEIVVDSHERYGYAFRGQQVTTRRAALPAGDYGVQSAGELVAAVERKSLADLVSSLTTGKLKYQLADLASLSWAAVVVEDRYSQIFKHTHVRPAVIADGLAECQVRWPGVPIHFCETRALAEEWTYRFLAAAVTAAEHERGGDLVVQTLVAADPLPAPVSATSVPATSSLMTAKPETAQPGVAQPATAQIRAWAREHGIAVSDRGRIAGNVVEAYDAAHGRGE